jgi:F420 biosynthesis protein FbiB-like protein
MSAISPPACPAPATAPDLEPTPDTDLDTGLETAAWSRLSTLIRGRRSIRRYIDRPISTEVLTRLVEAAHWAPSAHNRQPWRFCVVTSAEAKQRLAQVMGEQWQADLYADGADPDFIARRVAISRARMTGAAALVVASLTLVDMDRYPDPARAQAEWTMATQSVALACQNLLLAAEAHGLGACWMCAPLFVPEVVCAVLELPADWEPQALITLGYPAETKHKTREPLATRLIWR